MNKLTKDVARYILLIILMLGASDLLNQARLLNEVGKLSTEYAGIVAVYLGVWGYVVKWFFTTKTTDNGMSVNDDERY